MEFRLTAPKVPTTEQLLVLSPFEEKGANAVSNFRQQVTDRLNGKSDDLIAIVGSYSPPQKPTKVDLDIVNGEAEELRSLNEGKLIALARFLPWIARSRPKKSWNGLETNNPYVAFDTMTSIVNAGGGLGAQIGLYYHPKRYGHLLSIAWTGARHLDSEEVFDLVCRLLDSQTTETTKETPKPSVGVTNGSDGEIGTALEVIDSINDKYAHLGRVAFLIYAGSEIVRNSNKWEEIYRQAFEATNGLFMVNVAEGSEMAHCNNFNKTEEGQKAALEHVIQLSGEGLLPMGVMIEGSDLSSPTNPNIPFSLAKNGIVRLTEIAGQAR